MIRSGIIEFIFIAENLNLSTIKDRSNTLAKEIINISMNFKEGNCLNIMTSESATYKLSETADSLFLVHCEMESKDWTAA
jgi:hypothetical protein